tara:strand:+ start:185 stop:691 length:507 start_codon:yes stop_codon:yes gene_type:complete
MRKQTTFVVGILSLISFIQPLNIKNGLFLSTASSLIFQPQKVVAEETYFFEKELIELQKLKEVGDFNGQISLIKKILKENPNMENQMLVAFYFDMANSYLAINKLFEALRVMNEVIEINPNSNGRAYAFRGIIKLRMKNLKDACSDIRIADGLGYENAKYVLSRIGCD